MDRITLNAPAKINLTLAITGKREDGYHLLRSVMQAISLFDTITVEKVDGNAITLTCDHPDIPCDCSNIAYKAAMATFSALGLPPHGLKINIKKKIPAQAGLGGGSADGAAVIVAINELFECHATPDILRRIALSVGADLPFCLMGATALAEGIGEILSPLPSMPDCTIVVCKPAVGVSTAQAYKEYDTANVPYSDSTDRLILALQQQDLTAICQAVQNHFEQLIPLPEVAQIRTSLLAQGALCCAMSGSGSAVYGIFDQPQNAKSAFTYCCDRGLQTFVVTPYPSGITKVE